MSKIEIIKQSVTITQILDRYGIAIKQGFCKCPLHEERTGSMRVYPKTNRFKCFSCGAYGTVVDIVEKMENCDTKQAIAYLNEWYNLGLSEELTHEQKRAYAERRRQDKLKQERQKRQKQYENELHDRISTEYRELSDTVYAEQRKQTEVFRNGGEPDILFVGGLMRLQRLEWLLGLLGGDVRDGVELAMYGADKVDVMRKVYKGSVVV